ncbi:proline:sodium symporter PutP [Denitrobacterium detoxificans]|uniref:Sodium/proline symporter n=2 Tax=Denitrobacterium detoxificans TaxID=79604 RepID=A0A172RYY9_9ACTN|nr:sodium/proline symporter [Denitrobacterium detoxificans]ANE22929.1 proline:sodium symporter PutP [Denitrobacterium detoxificans]SEO73293.1 sodium/proline symporter [Denitrobacterium detoxificans]
MENSDSLVVVAILIYFIAVLTIGFIYAKRSNSSASEYFLGGRKVGPWFTALSAEASDMSGYLLMGLPGLAFFTGAGEAGWTAVGLAIGTYLNWRLVAKRLRRYSVVANDSITLPGFYSNRFHDSKNIVGTIAAVIILLFFCVYTGSCFVTCGKLFHTLFGWDYSVMMVFGALIVFMYTMVGGYLSVVATDFVQGCLMFFALLVVVIGSITMAGGVQATAAFLSDIPGFLSATSVATPLLDESGAQMAMDGTPLFDDPTPFGVLTIISTLSWGLGYFGMPQVLVRFLGIRSEEEVKQSRIIAVVWVVISMLAAVLIGLIGRKALPTLLGGAVTSSSAESIFIMLSQVMLPAFMCGIVVSGILAASMSSASSYLLITGSSVAENIFRGIFKKDATDEQVLIVSRITLTVVLLFGILVAWNEDSVIFTVVSYAWAGLGASFGPLTLFSLYWKRTTKQGAIAGMLTGAATVLIWHNFIKPLGGVFGIYELLPAFLLSCLAIYVVSKLTPAPSPEILADFDRYENHDVSKERNMEVVLEDGMTLND